MNSDFSAELDRRYQQAQEAVMNALPRAEGFQKTLLEAMNYSIVSGGKRLRPILIQASCELFGKDGRDAGPMMAAMEMIHTHSLIHDDLPAMDNDLYRRGKKTTHAVYGEAMGILAGDGLLNLAYETALSSLVPGPMQQGSILALQTLARKTGCFGMIGGQSVDVEKDGRLLKENELDFVYRLKTAALIEASLMMGAQLAGADEKQVQVMEQIGHCIGLAFQIRDDILDEKGDPALIGKSVGSDRKNDKTTFVSVYGLDQADAQVRAYSKKALELLESLNIHNQACVFLQDLIRSLEEREM